MTIESPNIRNLRVAGARTIVVTWKGGAESTIDLTDHLAAYAIFAPLRLDEQAFRTVTLGDWGWNAHWTEDMEISSDTLRRLALEQGSAWLRRWRTDRGMTQHEASTALGVSPRMWRYYESGTHLLPKTVRLACLGFDAQAKAA